MANCQRQPQFCCPRRALRSVPLPWQPFIRRQIRRWPRPNPATPAMWAWCRPGPQLASQLRAPADAAPEREQLQHTTPAHARERQQAARRGRIPGAQADGEDTTPMQNPRQGEGDIHNFSMHRSSSKRHTNDQEPQVHRFASYRFRVCRHG